MAQCGPDLYVAANRHVHSDLLRECLRCPGCTNDRRFTWSPSPVFQLPETPLWLLSKGRTAEAERSLQWLRGWVPASAVATEFEATKRYSERANCCVACQKADAKCTHPRANIANTLRELLRKRTRRPFALIMFCFVVTQFGGMHSIRPYMVQIFSVFSVPIDPSWTTVC